MICSLRCPQPWRTGQIPAWLSLAPAVSDPARRPRPSRLPLRFRSCPARPGAITVSSSQTSRCCAPSRTRSPRVPCRCCLVAAAPSPLHQQALAPRTTCTGAVGLPRLRGRPRSLACGDRRLAEPGFPETRGASGQQPTPRGVRASAGPGEAGSYPIWWGGAPLLGRGPFSCQPPAASLAEPGARPSVHRLRPWG